MTQETHPITIATMPDATRLAREVNETGKARLVQLGGDVVCLTPYRPRRRAAGKRPTPDAIAAALAVAGAWESWLDVEQFKRDREALQQDDKPVRAL